MSTDTTQPEVSPIRFAEDWERWHRGHEERRADRHGFLAVTGLHWLAETPIEIEGIPGRWSATDAGGPAVELAEGERLSRDGAELTGDVALGPLEERTGVDLDHGDVRIEVARRGGRYIVRPRDPKASFLDVYKGTEAYPPLAKWRREARFVPHEQPVPTTVGAAAPGIEHVYEAPGVLEFTAPDGTPATLTAFNGYAPGTLLVLFTDATSGVTTYAANRSIAVPAPDAEGRTVLDFTRAVNLPCAYTDHATCPLPPAENRLPFAVEAGELSPSERLTAEGIETVEARAPVVS